MSVKVFPVVMLFKCLKNCSHLLDHEKTFWVQQAFNNEFNASGYWLLFLHELRVLKTKSAKHFVCKGIMKDGTELYRHHVIASKIGMSRS